MKSVRDLQRVIMNHDIGRIVVLKIQRDGAELDLNVETEMMPDFYAMTGYSASPMRLRHLTSDF